MTGTLAEKLARAGASTGDRPAILCGGRSVTYAEMDVTARRLAGMLAAQGVGPGDRVAVRLADKADFLALTLGLIRTGAIAVPLDREDAEGQAALIDDCAPSLVLHDESLACRVANGRSPEDLADVPEQALPEVEPEDVGLILYTSGTLGTRKGVLVTQANLAATVDYIAAFMGIEPEIVEYVASPIDHAFGFGRCRTVLSNGGTLVLDNDPFNAIKALALLGKHGCNAYAGAATSMSMLVGHFRAHLAKLAGQLRWIELGSVPMTRDHQEALCATLPGCRVVMNYGMTEAQRSTLIDFASETSKIGTVGRASPGCRVRVRRSDGALAGPGEPGVVEVAGPHVAAGYWRRQDLWESRLRDGWFETDDTGSLDADRYLTFIGRTDDMINLGGDKISPVDVEHLLLEALDGRSFAVCAAEDPQGLYGEIPVLCLEGAAGSVDWAELRSRLQTPLTERLLPRRAVRVESLPRTGNGKVQRKLLRKWIEDGKFME